MNRTAPLLVLALALAAPAEAAAFDFRARLKVSPGAGVVRAESLAIPRHVKQWRQIAVRVDGKLAPMVEQDSDCTAELLARHVLIRLDSCGKRAKVKAITLGTVDRVVRVRLLG